MKSIRALGLIITLIIMVFSCEEDKDPAGQRNAAVIPVISNINPGIFDSKDLLNSYVEFNVDVPAGTQVDKVVILGSYKDNSERIEITEVTSFPATVRITSAATAEKLGIALNDISNGEVFTFELLTVANGLTTRSNAVLNVSVACAFVNSLAIGSYHTVSLDWGSEGDITLTADPNDPYTIYVAGIEEIEGLVEDKGPLVMHIDPATYEVIADKSVIASDAFGYTDITYEGSGVYNSCNGSFTMNFDISVVEGNFGRFLFNFTRNP
jgi:hypothetical protein